MKIFKITKRKENKNFFFISEKVYPIFKEAKLNRKDQTLSIRDMRGEEKLITPEDWDIILENNNYEEKIKDTSAGLELLEKYYGKYKAENFKSYKDKYKNLITAEIQFGLDNGFIVYVKDPLGENTGCLGYINLTSVRQFEEYWQRKNYVPAKKIPSYKNIKEKWKKDMAYLTGKMVGANISSDETSKTSPAVQN